MFYADKLPAFLVEFYQALFGTYFNKQTIESMLLENGEGRELYQYITHLFLHGDYRHLLLNVNAFLDFSRPVNDEFGAVGVYSVFFGGGVAAAIPSIIHDWHIKSSLIDLERLVSSKDFDKLPGNMKEIAEKLWQKVQDGKPKRSCGSSGAVAALSGCYLTLCCRNVYLTLLSAVRNVPPPPSPPLGQASAVAVTVKHSAVEDSSSYNLEEPAPRGWLQYFNALGKSTLIVVSKSGFFKARKLWRNCWHMYTLANYHLSEVDNVFGIFTSSQADGGQLIRLTARTIQRNCVAHSLHLQGFLSGVAFATVFGILVPAYQRRRLRQHL